MKEGALIYNRDTDRYDVMDGRGEIIVDGLHCGDVFDVYAAELYAGDPARAEQADKERRWTSARIETDMDGTWFLVADGGEMLFEQEPGISGCKVSSFAFENSPGFPLICSTQEVQQVQEVQQEQEAPHDR